jgi:hypothetical protein
MQHHSLNPHQVVEPVMILILSITCSSTYMNKYIDGKLDSLRQSISVALSIFRVWIKCRCVFPSHDVVFEPRSRARTGFQFRSGGRSGACTSPVDVVEDSENQLRIVVLILP